MSKRKEERNQQILAWADEGKTQSEIFLLVHKELNESLNWSRIGAIIRAERERRKKLEKEKK